MTVTITCHCGRVATFDQITRHADEFCPACDYPLFWLAPDIGAGVDDGDGAYRRSAGAEGDEVIATRRCPNCGELNKNDRVRCVRCNEWLVAPVPPKPEPRPMPAMRELPPEIPDPPRWPQWVALGTLALVALALIYFVWFA